MDSVNDSVDLENIPFIYDLDYGLPTMDTDSTEPEDSKRRAGRKLMTAEPSTKRKAQNRAAQRAFRERKEKHLQDLETRVAELENESHSMSTENLFLKKQVDRLQSELKEYRKRQSVAGSAKSSPAASHNYITPFTFEFPLFGADSKANVKSGPQSVQSRSSVAPSPTTFGNSLFMPYSPNGSTVNQGSPSSCASSSSNSPGLNATIPADNVAKRPSCGIRASSLYGDDDENDFCAQLSMACGTRENPIPRAQSKGVLSPPLFDNDLFSEYREPIFTADEEEFTLPELTPDDMFDNINELSEVNDLSEQQEPAIKEEEVVPADNKPLMGCTALWDRISMHPKFGDIDIDVLCSELRTKAKCSESGVVVTESDLNAVLKKIDAQA
ncbi:transcription factor PAP1-domain-containing protein [Lipomyces arxii]|uniref:transcription factor PAP1-domain-containing protein n=1 Tax=Lipomyces arxii TaxID=56418 RepID=UPI0034CE4EE9